MLQINVIQSGLFEARFDRRFGLLVAHCSRRDLGCEEDVAPRDFALPYGIGAWLLVAIDPC